MCLLLNVMSFFFVRKKRKSSGIYNQFANNVGGKQSVLKELLLSVRAPHLRLRPTRTLDSCGGAWWKPIHDGARRTLLRLPPLNFTVIIIIDGPFFTKSIFTVICRKMSFTRKGKKIHSSNLRNIFPLAEWLVKSDNIRSTQQSNSLI